jgi:hypothetical protein
VSVSAAGEEGLSDSALQQPGRGTAPEPDHVAVAPVTSVPEPDDVAAAPTTSAPEPGDVAAAPATSAPPRGRVCEHGRQRRYCRPCGGSAICLHGRNHRYCRDCGGSAICSHKKARRYCRECKGSTSSAEAGSFGRFGTGAVDVKLDSGAVSPLPAASSELARCVMFVTPPDALVLD